MTRAIYLLGGSGSGKSTLMAKLLEQWAAGPYVRLTDREMFGHYLMGPNLEVGVYLGRLRPEYPGTDALSLSVAPQALIWLEKLETSVGWVFGEGVRLGHVGFLSALAAKTDLVVVHLMVSPEVAAARRANRPGKQLSAQYCKVVDTTASNNAEACRALGIRVVTLDGHKPIEELAERVLVLG